MSLPNQLIVSGAGTADVNGTYTKGADIGGRSAWNLDSNNDISLFIASAGFSLAYAIRRFSGAQEYFYVTDLFSSADFPESPVGITLNIGTNPLTGSSVSGAAPAPTVAAAAPATVITFPASPALNDIHTVGTRSWKYNGTAWKLVPKTTDAILEGTSNLYFTDARVASTSALAALEARVLALEAAQAP
jgi:hypothetical protein